jgi:hypothetical protein
MTALIKTGLEILLPFLLFVRFQDFIRVSGDIARCVSVGDSDINNAISSARPKTTDQYVSSFITFFPGITSN